MIDGDGGDEVRRACKCHDSYVVIWKASTRFVAMVFAVFSLLVLPSSQSMDMEESTAMTMFLVMTLERNLVWPEYGLATAKMRPVRAMMFRVKAIQFREDENLLTSLSRCFFATSCCHALDLLVWMRIAAMMIRGILISA